MNWHKTLHMLFWMTFRQNKKGWMFCVGSRFLPISLGRNLGLIWKIQPLQVHWLNYTLESHWLLTCSCDGMGGLWLGWGRGLLAGLNCSTLKHRCCVISIYCNDIQQSHVISQMFPLVLHPYAHMHAGIHRHKHGYTQALTCIYTSSHINRYAYTRTHAHKERMH